MIAWAARLVWLPVLATFVWLLQKPNATWPRAAVYALALALAVKFVITALNFVLAAWANRKDPVGFRLHPLRLLYGFLSEQWATTLSLVWTLPWLVNAKTPTPAIPRADRLPVLFIHGYVCNRGFWIPAARLVAQKGFVVECITLSPPFTSIEHYVATIHNAVEALKTKTGSRQVVLVCHSMGGLAARAYMRAHGDASVAHAITCGTPHDGTIIAQLGLGENTRQMECKSVWRKALALEEPASRYAKFTTIYSRIDNIVAPARTAVLPGAKEIELIDVGHVAMGFAPRCIHVLIDELEQVSKKR